MNKPPDSQSPRYTWEEAIEVLRGVEAHRDLIFHAYLTADLLDNCRRFEASTEFQETLRILAGKRAGRRLLDIPAGNGIGTYAFTRAGYEVTAVDPDPSASVGRGAISSVLMESGLSAQVIDAFGERLPFEAGAFDVVYVRQGLHHAADLTQMLREFARVLQPGGLLLACREPVVDNYGSSLKSFLDAQVDHQLYGGENAFTLNDYRAAIEGAGFSQIEEFDPVGSDINLFPDTQKALAVRLLSSRPGRLLGILMSPRTVLSIGLWYLRRQRMPGRLFSFVARKPA